MARPAIVSNAPPRTALSESSTEDIYSELIARMGEDPTARAW